MKGFQGIIGLIVILASILVNCTYPVFVPVQSIDIPMEEIMNDFTVMPVIEYPAYYVGPNGQVFGIMPDIKVAADMDPVMPVAESVPIMVEKDGAAVVKKMDVEKVPDAFFVIDGVLYFSVSHYFGPVDLEDPEDVGETVVKYCRQSGDALEYLEEGDFPPEPDVMRGTFDDGYVSLAVGDYNGNPISVVVRAADQARFDVTMDLWKEPAKKPTLYSENFGMVDGMTRIVDGYMLHVVEGRGSARLPGLLYWPDGLNRMDHMNKDAGRFWMM